MPSKAWKHPNKLPAVYKVDVSCASLTIWVSQRQHVSDWQLSFTIRDSQYGGLKGHFHCTFSTFFPMTFRNLDVHFSEFLSFTVNIVCWLFSIPAGFHRSCIDGPHYCPAHWCVMGHPVCWTSCPVLSVECKGQVGWTWWVAGVATHQHLCHYQTPGWHCLYNAGMKRKTVSFYKLASAP